MLRTAAWLQKRHKDLSTACNLCYRQLSTSERPSTTELDATRSLFVRPAQDLTKQDAVACSTETLTGPQTDFYVHEVRQEPSCRLRQSLRMQNLLIHLLYSRPTAAQSNAKLHVPVSASRQSLRRQNCHRT